MKNKKYEAPMVRIHVIDMEEVMDTLAVSQTVNVTNSKGQKEVITYDNESHGSDDSWASDFEAE